jgi:hypothetical protein
MCNIDLAFLITEKTEKQKTENRNRKAYTNNANNANKCA